MDELQQLPPARLQDRGPSRVRPRAGHRDDHRSAGPGPRQRRRHGAGRAAAQRAARRRHRRPLHLRDRRRRLPDGGHQPRGDLACRAPQAQQADRAVRRQLDLHRRADLARRLRRPGRALRGRRAGAPCAIDGHDPEAIAGAHRVGAALRQADADRLQDRSSATARRPSRARPPPTASRSGADEIKGARDKLGWAHAPFEVPADVLAAWRAAGARGSAAAQGLGAARGQARCRASAALLGDPVDAAALAGASARRSPRSRRVRRRRRPRSPPASPRRRCSRSWSRRCPA